MGLVTEEHQDPALAVEKWIKAEHRTVDDVVERLLKHPPVIVTREEDRRIPSRFRKGGNPSDRYKEAGIETSVVAEGTFEFYRKRLSTRVSVERGAYLGLFRGSSGLRGVRVGR